MPALDEYQTDKNEIPEKDLMFSPGMRILF